MPNPHFDPNSLQILDPTAIFESTSDKYQYLHTDVKSNTIIPKHKLFFLHSTAVNAIQLHTFIPQNTFHW